MRGAFGWFLHAVMIFEQTDLESFLDYRLLSYFVVVVVLAAAVVRVYPTFVCDLNRVKSSAMFVAYDRSLQFEHMVPQGAEELC